MQGWGPRRLDALQNGVGSGEGAAACEEMLGVLCHMGGRLLPGSLICPRRTAPITTPFFLGTVGLAGRHSCTPSKPSVTMQALSARVTLGRPATARVAKKQQVRPGSAAMRQRGVQAPGGGWV